MCLVIVGLLQAWMMWNFINFHLKRMRERSQAAMGPKRVTSSGSIKKKEKRGSGKGKARSNSQSRSSKGTWIDAIESAVCRGLFSPPTLLWEATQYHRKPLYLFHPFILRKPLNMLGFWISHVHPRFHSTETSRTMYNNHRNSQSFSTVDPGVCFRWYVVVKHHERKS